METSAFLARVVPAQGNYLTVQWKSPGHGWALRSYKPAIPDQIDAAASMLRWAAKKGADCYHAIAAFNMAEVGVSTKGEQTIKAKREQANVHLIKVLVADADVKREGDGKKVESTFPDRRKVIEWMLGFTNQTKIPMPNLAVNSGYGVHFYWVLEDAVTLQVWQPLANALKAAMVAYGWVGDTSPTVDGARLLRPPGTVNMKSGTPVPVDVLPKFTSADYPNQQMIDALQPWFGMQQRSTGTHGSGTGTVSPILGPRPAHVPPGPGAGLNQAAHSGLESRYKFSEIMKRCDQLKTSIANRGNGDLYQIWYLGHHTLAAFTPDGHDHIDAFSDGDPRFNHDENEAAHVRAKAEADRKGFGAPTCQHYDDHRPGICGGCPFKGKVKSPIALGLEAGDLPYRYRKSIKFGAALLERLDGKGDDAEWVPMIAGEVSKPRLDELPTGGHKITFTYALAGKAFPVSASDIEVGHMTPVSYFTKQGVHVDRHSSPHFGDFAMAWIEKLRVEHVTSTDTVRHFGWNFNEAGQRVGVAIAGTLYRCDGTEEAVPGGDPKVAAMYRPVGDLANWRRAAALFEGGRADLQALIATSFGAPLVGLCGDVRGMTMNFWSTESGIGKSTAIKVGQSIWGDFKSMQSMRDTPNAVMRSLSEPRILIRYWDELRVRRDYQDDFVEMIFTIPQGKERARLMADTTLREVGEWETFLVFTSNRSCQDYLLAKDDGTDSGLARLLEIEMAKEATPFDPVAGQAIKLCETNYGHAGRVYAKDIAEYLPSVQKHLADLMAGFTKSLDMQRDERFGITAISCTLVGAVIARKLGLFNFDLAGIRDTLIQAFRTQREQRSRRTVVSSEGGFDLEEIVNEFVYAQADYRLRTDIFSPGGSAKVSTFAEPQRNTVRIQIAEREGVLRVSRATFNEWLRDKNRPASTIVDDLKTKMGAKEYRKALGGGTRWGGGAVWVLDIPLTGRLSELASSGEDKTPGRKSPADAVRG